MYLLSEIWKDNIVARYIKNARFDQNTGPIPSEIDEDVDKALVQCDGGLEFMEQSKNLRTVEVK